LTLDRRRRFGGFSYVCDSTLFIQVLTLDRRRRFGGFSYVCGSTLFSKS
jgi:hypothetical protein